MNYATTKANFECGITHLSDQKFNIKSSHQKIDNNTLWVMIKPL